MRWLALYARSRQVAVPILALVLGTALLLGLSRWLWDGRVGIPSMIIVMTLGLAAASPGLAGSDHDLDRTASFSWPPRRATHLIGLGVVTTGLSLAINATLDSGLPAGVILRDVAGQVGLLGLGVALIGGSFGWCLPFLFMVLAQVPGMSEVPVAGWLVQPADTVSATLTAAAAVTAGLLSYLTFGPRRTWA
jgi:hypothetical protein